MTRRMVAEDRLGAAGVSRKVALLGIAGQRPAIARWHNSPGSPLLDSGLGAADLDPAIAIAGRSCCPTASPVRRGRHAARRGSRTAVEPDRAQVYPQQPTTNPREGALTMPATVVCGLQWGDEGKGKATDLLADRVSIVVRYQGGDNAGHTVVHRRRGVQAPPGARAACCIRTSRRVIGPGVVVNPRTLLDEMAMLNERGIATDKLRVSGAAHVIMPYHVALDGAREARRGRRRHRHDQARHRAGVRRPRVARRACAWATCSSPRCCASASGARWPRRTRCSTRATAARPFELDALVAEALALGRAAAPTTSPTRPASSSDALARRRARAARGRAGHPARPRPRHVSVRDAATRSPAARARAAASGRSRSTRSSAS